MTKKTAGYSLIEVLIAFVIMASVLAVLLPSNTSLFVAIPRVQNRLLAQDYAQSRLATLGISRPILAGTDQGYYREVWMWQETITLRPESTPDLQLFEVSIKILLPDNTEVASITVLKATQ